jgi:hypothetical protein
VYLQFSPQASALAAEDAARVRGAAPSDWARFVAEHPAESAALTNTLTALWTYPSRAAFAVCGAPRRSAASPRYAFEGEAELARARATVSGWACLRAPPGEQAMCDCIAGWLSGATSFELHQGDPALVYRGGISLLL